MPRLTGAGLNDPGILAGFHQLQTRHLHLDDQGVHIPGEHDVAPTPKDEPGQATQLGVSDHRAHILHTPHPHQTGGPAGKTEGIERSEIYIVFNQGAFHELLADSSSALISTLIFFFIFLISPQLPDDGKDSRN
jgi:hypothetical protein